MKITLLPGANIEHRTHFHLLSTHIYASDLSKHLKYLRLFKTRNDSPDGEPKSENMTMFLLEIGFIFGKHKWTISPRLTISRTRKLQFTFHLNIPIKLQIIPSVTITDLKILIPNMRSDVNTLKLTSLSQQKNKNRVLMQQSLIKS